MAVRFHLSFLISFLPAYLSLTCQTSFSPNVSTYYALPPSTRLNSPSVSFSFLLRIHSTSVSN
ncbi:hypothetical protein COCSADRAFT_233344 [Bipolaris sorokiniana ND90Pr]|uniref:Uncharacterized protein n=1 Tax=Cochliobolus sativus (strain ND90Pr / ATCC 201652) TaxID=665912 RepID=M2S377_COCSN|nr:uncharacterized protein COCSADRAFT_233344 [Bipolaris sorokiniana ND90Pr]EMD61618.1 hypothetical protein COCSADRAFT_233344 [Bipolaris sorokiniana ND90Pr]